MMSAKLFVPCGTPDQNSGGEMFPPSLEYLSAMLLPVEKAVVFNFKLIRSPEHKITNIVESLMNKTEQTPGRQWVGLCSSAGFHNVRE